MVDVITMGEALIDFVPQQRGCSLEEVKDFSKAAGGAPANVAVGLAKLGIRVGFVGKVGDDAFGRFLKKTLEENGVDTQNLVFTSEAMTTLAFVSLEENGERDFAFYRKPGADMLLRQEEVDFSYLAKGKIFHFGSLSLTTKPIYSTTMELIKRAKSEGIIISFDPNIRLPLWNSKEAAVNNINKVIPLVDLIKLSKEELFILTGQKDLSKGSKLLSDKGPGIVIVTLGQDGSYFYTAKHDGYVKGVNVNVIDTTGAGDGFMAGFLAKLLKTGLEAVKKDHSLLKQHLAFANKIGAFVTTREGGIPALASIDKRNLYPF